MNCLFTCKILLKNIFKITHIYKIIFLEIFILYIFLNTTTAFALEKEQSINGNAAIINTIENSTVCDSVYGTEQSNSNFHSFKYNDKQILAKPTNCILYVNNQEIYCENPITIKNDTIILNTDLKNYLDNNLPTTKVHPIIKNILIDKITNHNIIYIRTTIDGKTIKSYPTGTTIRILEQLESSWVKIMLPDFSVGYVRNIFLSPKNILVNNHAIKLDIIEQHSDGFYLFTYNNKQILAHPDNFILSIDDIEIYCKNPISIENNIIVLNDDLKNYLDYSIPTSKIHPIILGELINQVTKNDTIPIYDNINGKIIKKYKTKNIVKILNQGFDGWLQIMLPDGLIGYIDGRHLRIKEGISLPPVDMSSFTNKKIKNDYIIIVNQEKQNIQIYKKLDSNTYFLDISSKISTGLFKTPTPNGWFTIKNRKGPWMYITKLNVGIEYYTSFKGSYLLHGVPSNKNKIPLWGSVNKLGHKASHGCIRMPRNIAEKIYRNVEAESILIIDSTPPLIENILSNFSQL